MRRAERGGIFFRLLFLLFFLAFLALIYVVRRPFLRLAGQLWVVDEPAEHADVIVVLGGDNFVADRAAHAAELYRAGLASQVVASGRLLRPYAGISEMTARDLESRGVPAASIVKFSHRAANTREEAEALAGLAANRGWKRVLVVTSNYHTRRTLFIFGRIFGPGVTVRLSAAHDSEFDPSHWWESRLGIKLFFNEVVAYAVAWWELRGKPHAAGGAAFSGHTLGYLFGNIRRVQTYVRLQGQLLYIIVPSLPSSPGRLQFPRPCGYGVSVGGTNVA